MAFQKENLSGSLRSSDGLNEVIIVECTEETVERATALVREHWSTARDEGLVDSQPVKIFVSGDDRPVVTYAFRWRTEKTQKEGAEGSDSAKLLSRLEEFGTVRKLTPAYEAYQGFEYRRFPPRGGTELLRGKCTCKLALDAFFPEGRPESTRPGAIKDPAQAYEEFQGIEVDGENGFVLMHRSPRIDIEQIKLMDVTIVAHGADNPNPFANTSFLPLGLDFGDFKVRVEQNTDLPQFGIIRGLSGDSDFPATALWVVHWRIHTPLGTIITDPNVPLVFGPTRVKHYPPVGTEFFSSTGPVDVYSLESGQVVGSLAPGQLTAFDIVVTMDDIVPSLMDVPARYHVELFNRHVPEEQRIPVSGLTDDFRIPEQLKRY